MKTAVIHETDFHRVVSHGNGLAYELRELTGADERSVFFQGDDAWQFAKELGRYTKSYGEVQGLGMLWAEYQHIAD